MEPQSYDALESLAEPQIDNSLKGHKGQNSLNGVVLADVLFNLFYYPIVWGITVQNCAIISCFSNDNKAASYQLYKSMMLLILILPIQLCVFLFSDKLFILINQDQNVSQICVQYCLTSSIGLVVYTQYDAINKYLNVTGRQNVCLFIQIIATPLHILACYVLTSIYNLGVVGIGIAFSITETIKLLLLIAYLLHYDVGLVKLEFDGSVIHGIFLTLKQTSSSIIMMCLEFWMFEVITIMSGFFPSREINIQGILMNVETLLIEIPTGVSIGCISMIAFYLKPESYKIAKLYSQTVQLMGICIGLILGITLLSFRYLIAQAYTDMSSIQSKVADDMPILALFIIIDVYTFSLQDIFRAVNKTNYAVLGQFVSIYVIGIPLAYVFAFKLELYVKGLWLGLCVALIVASTFYQFLLNFKLDWKKLSADKACEIQVVPLVDATLGAPE